MYLLFDLLCMTYCSPVAVRNLVIFPTMKIGQTGAVHRIGNDDRPSTRRVTLPSKCGRVEDFITPENICDS